MFDVRIQVDHKRFYIILFVINEFCSITPHKSFSVKVDFEFRYALH